MTSGYGTIYVSAETLGRERPGQRGAHRVAFYLVRGYWPTAALHGCDFKLCCNAENQAHIHDGTLALNNQEMRERGRQVVWGKTPLTAEQRAEIATRYAGGDFRLADLAPEYGVSLGRIGAICQAAGVSRGKHKGEGGRFA